MRTALDSSVLILLSRRQAGWEAWRDCLQTAADEGQLLISPVAFAEYSIAYPSKDSAQADLDPITPAAAYLAGQIFLHYRREGGPRQDLIPDFIIAAHATTQTDRIAVLDRGYLRIYFPNLPQLAPSDT